MTEITAAFVQFRPRFGRIEENVHRIEALLKGLDAHLAVLPELASTGYSFESRKQLLGLAESPESSVFLESLARICRTQKMHVATGFAEKSGSRVYNSAALVSPKGLVGVYRKMHLFYREKDLFDRASSTPEVFDAGFAQLGLAVCFDWIFPELFRTLALLGAEIICHSANLVLPHCQKAMVTRSVENRIFTITANRVGTEKGKKRASLTFTGKSQIVSPRGEVLVKGSARGECIGLAEIDLREARNKLVTPKNDVFKDRRTDLYRL